MKNKLNAFEVEDSLNENIPENCQDHIAGGKFIKTCTDFGITTLSII